MKSNVLKKWILMAMLLVSITASAYDFEADGIYYNISSMSELEVEVTYGSGYTGDIIVPPHVNYNNRTFTVTSIGNAAFRYNGSLTSVMLPETIRKIGTSSFYSSNITSINLPEGLVEISSSAFEYTKICSLIIPESVTTIGNHAFRNCNKLLEVFCTSKICPSGLTTWTFEDAHPSIEIYVPSTEIYGFGREYLSFPTLSFDYTGRSHIIEWTNNLKAYKCEISESECNTDINVGEYTKYLKARYYDGIDLEVEIPYSYTITKVPMTLTVNDVQREYGEPNPTFTCSISGFVNGENEAMLGVTPTFECEASQISKVGNYRILASLETPNYEITYNYGTLSVVKAPLTVSVIDAARIYGNDNPDFSLSFSGLKNGETVPDWSVKPRISTTAAVSSKVGEYSIIASDGVADNYEVVKYNPGTLTVNKRDLIVKANDCERLYQEENPSFEISYIGFVNNDSENSLIEKPIAECNASVLSDAGTYPIKVSGGEAENYSFTYQDGTLKVNPLKVGFKNIYNSVTYNNMKLSTSESHFNYIPEIIGPFSEDDFWVELWFLDKDNKYDQHVSTITEGDYAGNYVNTNTDRPMWAGKYIYNLKSKGTNPNVIADPSRAYLTVDRTSNNLEWNTNSPIILHVGDKIDLSISYQADLWCTFNTDYDEELIELSSEGKNGNNPHWFAKGLKEGETTLFFGIECKKNDLGFYDFSDSEILSKRIIVKLSAGIDSIGNDSTITVTVNDGSLCVSNKTHNSLVRVYTLQGTKIIETEDNKIENLLNGIYIVTVENRSFKVKI